ncbi:MAG: glycosyltransferase family 2 protein, partial [Clostridia bacterium]|nr:glycosyltransferase family 2 protein [Clostridia bacterium]
MYKEIDEVSPKVSIIVPMYNCELYIERCMESLLKQTYSNIEIIVVDDGSKDSCAKIVKMINEINSKVRYLFQNNSGPGTARNRAIKESTGKYILFVDSDDYLANDYVEELVASAERYNSDLVVAGYTLVYENSNKSLPVIPMKYEKGISEEWAYRISACCSRLYSKEFWDKQNLEFSEEKDARAEDVPIALY